MRNGDFSQLLAQTNSGRHQGSAQRAAFPEQCDSRRTGISSVSQAVNQTYLPAPNRGGADALASNYGFTFPFPQDYHLRKDFTQRIDYQHHQQEPPDGPHDRGLGALRAAHELPRLLLDARTFQHPHRGGRHPHLLARRSSTRRAWVSTKRSTPMATRSTE